MNGQDEKDISLVINCLTQDQYNSLKSSGGISGDLSDQLFMTPNDISNGFPTNFMSEFDDQIKTLISSINDLSSKNFTFQEYNSDMEVKEGTCNVIIEDKNVQLPLSTLITKIKTAVKTELTNEGYYQQGSSGSVGYTSTLPVLTPLLIDHLILEEEEKTHWINASLSNTWYDAGDYPKIWNHLTSDIQNGTPQILSVNYLSSGSGSLSAIHTQKTFRVNCIVAEDGHKIVVTTDDSCGIKQFDETGVFYFFRVNTTLGKFSLPMNIHYFGGIGLKLTSSNDVKNCVGVYTKPIFPNHRHDYVDTTVKTTSYSSYIQGTGKRDTYATVSKTGGVVSYKDVCHNSALGARAFVKPPSVRCILYFSTGV